MCNDFYDFRLQKAAGSSQEYVIIRDSTIVRRAIGMMRL